MGFLHTWTLPPRQYLLVVDDGTYFLLWPTSHSFSDGARLSIWVDTMLNTQPLYSSFSHESFILIYLIYPRSCGPKWFPKESQVSNSPLPQCTGSTGSGHLGAWGTLPFLLPTFLSLVFICVFWRTSYKIQIIQFRWVCRWVIFLHWKLSLHDIKINGKIHANVLIFFTLNNI